jgi:hypothetical protein
MIIVARMLLQAEHIGGEGQEVAHVVIHSGGSGPIVDAAARRCWPTAPADLVESEADRPALE